MKYAKGQSFKQFQESRAALLKLKKEFTALEGKLQDSDRILEEQTEALTMDIRQLEAENTGLIEQLQTCQSDLAKLKGAVRVLE